MQSSSDPAKNPDDHQNGIQEIHIAGFCSLKEVYLEPGRLTVLIGPNGAGKSNLLQALRLIPLLQTRSLQRYVADHGFGAALLHYGAKVTEAIDLGVVIRDQGTTYRYDARLAFAPDDTLYFQTENAARAGPPESLSRSPLAPSLRPGLLPGPACSPCSRCPRPLLLPLISTPTPI